MECVRCGAKDTPHYANDRTCKECRKARVRQNRMEKAEYYREYDRQRFKNDPKVRARHARYQSTPVGKAAILRAERAYRARNPEKYKAQNAVSNALRDGKLQKFDACEWCGCQERIEAHHPSYAEEMRLCVTWLCSPCHKRTHHPF